MVEQVARSAAVGASSASAHCCAGATGVAVGNHGHILDIAVLGERGSKRVFVGVEAQVSYIDLQSTISKRMWVMRRLVSVTHLGQAGRVMMWIIKELGLCCQQGHWGSWESVEVMGGSGGSTGARCR